MPAEKKLRRPPKPRPRDPIGELIDTLASFELDPLGFVQWAFPWGQAGTELAESSGPEPWQRDVLHSIGDQLQAGGDDGAIVLEQVEAGHGVGKSFLISCLIIWALTTRAHTRGVVTANTDTQLRTKTWAELSKWFNLFIGKSLYTLTATSIRPKSDNLAKSWRIDQIPWSKENTEAFAGLHNKGKRVIVLMDEASAIDDKVFEVTEGALTDAQTQIIWCCFGNPTRTSGHFYEVLSGQRPRWNHSPVDSRDVSFSNKKLINEWLREYGEDSDFFRVRVRGIPPRAGVVNFISPEVVDQARRREVKLNEYSWQPKIISCDQARFGDDKTIITLRQGPKIHQQIKFSGLDNVEVSDRIVDLWRKHPDTTAVVIEVAGLAGTGLLDILRRIPGLPVLEFNPAFLCEKDSEYLNLRARVWGMMRDWLRTAEIPDDKDLCKQLTDIEYGYSALMKIQLESKKDIKSRSGVSPDEADSIAISFFPEIVQNKRKPNAVKAPQVIRRKIIWNQHT